MDDDRGSATVQLVVATPALLLLLMIVVQFALWQHASHVVTAAAQQGAAAAQAEAGSARTGRQAASAFLAEVGNGVVRSPSVRVERGPDVTRVVVRGRSVAVVPGFGLPVRGAADGPTERFRARTQR